MRAGWLLVLGLASCGASSLSPGDQLSNHTLFILTSFNPPAPKPPALAAFLTYDHLSSACPAFEIAADLDGVPLEKSPAGTGQSGASCQNGFYLTASAPAAAPRSTVRFTGANLDASLVAVRLLEPRRWLTTRADGDATRAGEIIEFTWSTGSDGIDSAGAVFVNGDDRRRVEPQLVGTTARVTVPPLPSGEWMLKMGGSAHAEIADCVGAMKCHSQLVREETLVVVVQNP